MGFLDLSTNMSAKKHVDFNDARYQLSDKLRQSENKNVRASFTLYDNKEYKKTAVQDISAAYALSDKRLPMGELLNKMVDLTLDMEDGALDTEKDAVYAWKYSMALLEMFDDKSKRQDALAAFDNSLKTSVINSHIFAERYPGKYTARTNFFDAKVKEELVNDIIETFKVVALPGIHEAAIKQSHENADKHNNPILDKIVKWAVENYKCEVESFYQIKKDEKTNLFFSVNTVIIHLRNGYDMSVVGYVGTDYDDKFAVSVLDAQKITIQKHGEHVSQKDLQNTLVDASENEPINPLTKLISIEKKKNAILKEQYDILAVIRPMVPAEALQIKAAESVVGQDYIWGCAKFRETHEDLPKDFKLEDVILPEYIETDTQAIETEKNRELLSDISELANSIEVVHEATSEDVENKVVEMVEEVEFSKKELELNVPMNNVQGRNDARQTPEIPVEKTAEELLKVTGPVQNLFDETPKKVEELKFGDLKRSEFQMPILNIQPTATKPMELKDEEEKSPLEKQEFDPAATLLPGAIPIVKKQEQTGPSITGDAKPAPAGLSESLWKEEYNTETKVEPIIKEEKSVEQKIETPQEPALFLDDLDSLFE